MPQRHLNNGNVHSWNPTFCDKRLPPNIVVEEIEGLINDLFLPRNILPYPQVLPQRNKLCTTGLSCLIKNILNVFKVQQYFTKGLGTLFSISIYWVYRRSHGFSNFADLGKE